MIIEYRTGNNLELAAVIQLYKASTLGERRPIDDPGRFAAVRGEDRGRWPQTQLRSRLPRGRGFRRGGDRGPGQVQGRGVRLAEQVPDALAELVELSLDGVAFADPGGDLLPQLIPFLDDPLQVDDLLGEQG